MATIRKRGNTYQIRVSAGYNQGRQIMKTKTWRPAPGMTKRQIEKELEKQAVLFEQQVETGQFLDGSITLAEFADKWFLDYAQKQLQEKTVVAYRDMYPRIEKALGHIKLAKLQPHHLIEFYNNLSETGIREDTKFIATEKLTAAVKDSGYTQKAIAEKTGLSCSTVRQCCRYKSVAKTTAEKLTAALNGKMTELFTPINSNGTLAGTTIVKYHRLLSSILTAAVQWQVIPSNPCSRVKPPQTDYKEAAVLDEVQIAELIKCLNDEPLKYKTAIMLILYTGLRQLTSCRIFLILKSIMERVNQLFQKS